MLFMTFSDYLVMFCCGIYNINCFVRIFLEAVLGFTRVSSFTSINDNSKTYQMSLTSINNFQLYNVNELIFWFLNPVLLSVI